MPRIYFLAAVIVAASLVSSGKCYAQTADVGFGTVYGANNAYTENVLVQGTEAISGDFYSTSSQSLTTGTISVESSIYLTGQGQLLTLPVTFTSNSTSGSLSASFTAYYTCEGECSQPSLSIYITTSGNSIVASATAAPKYEVLSLLYDPPGNASTTGYGTQVSAGATTSISDNFSTSDSLTFGTGILGLTDNVTFKQGSSSGSTNSFTTTYQASQGSQLASPGQAIDHNDDVVYLLVDPSVTVNQTGASSGTYVIGPSPDATGYGSTGAPPDILHGNITGFKDPTQIPLDYLEPQVRTQTTTLPGLEVICANPLPASECTPQNACGCTSSDFTGIVAQDELANDTNQVTPPSSIDGQRFMYIGAELLDGPQQAGAGAVTNSYSISDRTVTSQSMSNGTSYSTGFTHGWSLSGPFGLSFSGSGSSTFTYSQTQTVGVQNGAAHTATVTLGTSDVGCQEYVDIYEDTTYHTFAYSLPQTPPSNCN